MSCCPFFCRFSDVTQWENRFYDRVKLPLDSTTPFPSLVEHSTPASGRGLELSWSGTQGVGMESAQESQIL